MPKEAAWPLHRPGSQHGRHPSAALLGPSAPDLPLNTASILPIRIRWWGQTYGGAEDGLAVALPNPWNPKRMLYLYLANSGPELWQMTRAFQPGQLQGWARYRHGEVVAKGFHDLEALAVELPAPAAAPEPPAPRVMPLGSATETN